MPCTGRRALPDAPVKLCDLEANRLTCITEDIRLFIALTPAPRKFPTITPLASKQLWRDLIGYYTRFGRRDELLNKIDDRYVIVASGDELSLRFKEQPPPAAGWVRDFVIVGDGWIKDGDFNSTFSKTVLPLPYHAKDYSHPAPGKS